MSDQETAQAAGSGPSAAAGRRGNPFSRFVRAIGVFFGQVLDEMRKVVRPTRQELTTYTTVVIIFVTVVMLFVLGLDTVFTKLVFWVFAG